MTAGRCATRAHNYGMWVPVLLCAESHISLAHRCFLTVRPSNREGFSQSRGQTSGCDLDHALGKPGWNWSDEFYQRTRSAAWGPMLRRKCECRGGHGWPRAKIRCLAVSYSHMGVSRERRNTVSPRRTPEGRQAAGPDFTRSVKPHTSNNSGVSP